MVFPRGQMLVLSGFILTVSSALANPIRPIDSRRLQDMVKIVDLAIQITEPRAEFPELSVERRVIRLAGINPI